MQKILWRKTLRELKVGRFRYLALGLMIALCMYIVTALIGAAETVIRGTACHQEKNCLEDGQFTVFVPLSEQEIDGLREAGAEAEAHFYLDHELEDGSVLRMMQVREKLDLLDLIDGEMPKEDTELVIERRYAEEHGMVIGDEIRAGSRSYRVSGVAAAPDYDGILKEFSDTGANSRKFGTAFVTADAYERIRQEGEASRSEEYVYAYRLLPYAKQEEIKAYLKTLKLSSDQIEDAYFQEYWERTGGKQEELEDGVDDLVSGMRELTDGLIELGRNNRKLNRGAEEIMDALLSEAEASLREFGLKEELTAENYEEVLEDLRERVDSAVFTLSIHKVVDQLDEVRSFRDGIRGYTDAVEEAGDGSDEILEGVEELEEAADELMDRYADFTLSNLQSFVPADENPRISAAANDQYVSLYAGIVCGVIIMILFTYVISVFVAHGIEQEAPVIGALYALGVRREDLLFHYVVLPTAVTFVSGLIGTLMGISPLGIPWQLGDAYHYFSLPVLETTVPVGLILYGTVMPPVTAVLVNLLVIRKKLAQTPLSLLRGEKRQPKLSVLQIRSRDFITEFRIRQMIREARSGAAVVLGMFITMLIMMLGLDCMALCVSISRDTKEDTRYEYMYTLKYPEEEVPEDGEAAYAYAMKKEVFGYRFDVTILGIEERNPYFDVETVEGKNNVVLSSAAAEKYGLHTGDMLILEDEEQEMNYAFTIRGIADYAPSFYAFMDLDSMRELFGQEDDYYNVVFADHALEIPAERLYAATGRAEIAQASDVFVNLMLPMVIMILVVSAMVFVLVLYLMMKVMIERSASHIALFKIFGYRRKEIRRLYLDGNFYLIALGALLSLPVSKLLMDALFPLLVSNVACGLHLAFPVWEYALIYGAVMLFYVIIHRALLRRTDQIVPAEVLKRRE